MTLFLITVTYLTVVNLFVIIVTLDLKIMAVFLINVTYNFIIYTVTLSHNCNFISHNGDLYLTVVTLFLIIASLFLIKITL